MRSWEEIEQARQALNMSRAEMCRLAAISESTVFKGLQRNTRPQPSIVRSIQAVFDRQGEQIAAPEQ